MMLIWTLRIAIAAIAIFAFRKGGEPERLVAAVLLASAGLDVFNHILFGEPAFYLVNPGHLVIDVWSMIALMWIALRANRAWPMWVSAAQIIVVLGHVSKIVELSLVRYGYYAMTQVPLNVQAAALLIGTIAHMRRQERIGNYNAWRLDRSWA
ncbi:MAG: hypothetical protein B7Y89_15785 [Novosphingobium sp. 32-60-15]|uniref:hypothetical protein n=1 Tax=unclassified Novosphingobium TaxID=2644732 RepID=UPI000BC8AC5C|nr:MULTISPECIES: hypothetical protein [unclassified Novosphingobium]OYX60581.1 MAG: hypothetical protein B7Y89_15785 [Novosphingobium sp. 32-60-15]